MHGRFAKLAFVFYLVAACDKDCETVVHQYVETTCELEPLKIGAMTMRFQLQERHWFEPFCANDRDQRKALADLSPEKWWTHCKQTYLDYGDYQRYGTLASSDTTSPVGCGMRWLPEIGSSSQYAFDMAFNEADTSALATVTLLDGTQETHAMTCTPAEGAEVYK